MNHPLPPNRIPPPSKKDLTWRLRCLTLLGCGALVIFLATLLFFFVVLKTADRLTSPATILTDRFLGHVCAGDLDRAYLLMAPAYQEQKDLPAFKADLEELGISGCSTWNKGGGTARLGGAAFIDAGVIGPSGRTRELTFTVVEIEDEWRIKQIKPRPQP